MQFTAGSLQLIPLFLLVLDDLRSMLNDDAHVLGFECQPIMQDQVDEHGLATQVTVQDFMIVEREQLFLCNQYIVV